ncbi:conserved membrane hypothetical protein [Nostocoides japonicum T1-X7]|uniref:DUF4184 family protein n=1 Tax=Nostocoides japonicum T1-X7 TaxID=1194083 RepID=A0A077LWW7_9MICO|nr:DUF4184 family protein [Tetrasphaera japonica]CCH77337.1 conserved membrane hypothetical protein [Tetrasphaera japonica T1-X7]CCH78685.1 conserved membrane hypothetical protein [Tetrasphaera japonica T1-X7]
MAFTPAHTLAALPVARSLGRARPVVFAALVIATMAPDAPYFVPVPVSRVLTHSLRGVVGVDALMSLAALLAWLVAVERPLRDLSPTRVRERLRPLDRRVRWSDVPLAYVAAVVGGLTHVVWDGFTHREGYVVEHWPALRTVHVQWPLYQWLQLGSSVVGCVLVAGYVVQALRSRRPETPPDRVVGWHHAAWSLLLAAFVAGVALGIRAMPPSPGRAAYLKNLVVPGLALTCAAAALVVVAWWAAALRGRRRRRASPRSSGAPGP